MKLNKYILLIGISLTTWLMSSCNSMENAPTNKFTDDTYWTSTEKAQYVVNMAYSQMYNATRMWSDESLSDNMIDGRSITDQRSIRKGQATPGIIGRIRHHTFQPIAHSPEGNRHDRHHPRRPRRASPRVVIIIIIIILILRIYRCKFELMLWLVGRRNFNYKSVK